MVTYSSIMVQFLWWHCRHLRAYPTLEIASSSLVLAQKNFSLSPWWFFFRYYFIIAQVSISVLSLQAFVFIIQFYPRKVRFSDLVIEILKIDISSLLFQCFCWIHKKKKKKNSSCTSGFYSSLLLLWFLGLYKFHFYFQLAKPLPNLLPKPLD